MMYTIPELNKNTAVCFFAPKNNVDLTGSYISPHWHSMYKTIGRLISNFSKYGYSDFITDGNFGFTKFVASLTQFNIDRKHHIVLNKRPKLSTAAFYDFCKAKTVTDISQLHTEDKVPTCTKYQQEANTIILENSSVSVVVWKHHLDFDKYNNYLANMIKRSLELNHPVVLLDPVTYEVKTLQP